jgi:hypothetical protein
MGTSCIATQPKPLYKQKEQEQKEKFLLFLLFFVLSICRFTLIRYAFSRSEAEFFLALGKRLYALVDICLCVCGCLLAV